MISTPKDYTDKLTSGRTLRHGQHDNGIHWAEIRGVDGLVESAVICPTVAAIFRWLREHNDTIAHS
jgi:hypothetical protein